MISPTPEQTAIIQATAQSAASLMISAYAGTAKTTTLELAAKELPQANSTLALAFNVKIKEELEKRLPSHITVKTMNGLGHGAWAKATGKRLNLDTSKLGKIITQEAKAQGLYLSRKAWAEARSIVAAARSAGLVPEKLPFSGLLPDTPESWAALAEDLDIDLRPQLLAFARKCLGISCTQAFQGLLDFDDQIYMSVLFGGIFPRFHTIIVDEAQDLSLMNHRMVAKCKPQRLLVCGDPKQSLSAFRGAANDSMGKMRALAQEWEDYPLTLTFRCPRVVVARQQDHAPGYRAAESNAQGEVIDLRGKPWDMTQIPTHGTTAVLCRNNAPLIKLAFKLLRQGIPVSMLGRDLGTGLVKVLEKLGLPLETPVALALEALAKWFELEKVKAGDNSGKIEKLTDRYESILAVSEDPKTLTLGDLITSIKTLFSQEKGRVVFGSGHRAKGLEWSVVVHLEPWRIPSRFAKTQADLDQEDNIRYVIETRTKHTLVLANLEDYS